MKTCIHRLIRTSLTSTNLDVLISKVGVFSPKVISWLDGGLGSQMWQFALGYCISKKTGLPLYLKTDFFTNNGCDIQGNPNRKFLLFETFPTIGEQFSDKIITTSDKLFLWLFSDYSFQRNSFYDFNPEIVFSGHSLFITQYYANAKYLEGYRGELRKLFQFNLQLNMEEQILLRFISEHNTCAVHIRKGDFVGSVHEVCTDAYYLEAMKQMTNMHPDTHFVIFSNDENYSKQLIIRGNITNATILEGRSEEDPRVDMYLMTKCKNFIIANSGFSWFPAFLADDNSTVIMPEYWTRNSQTRELSREAFKLNNWLQVHV